LGEVSDLIAKREALLGVSMTGMADSPEIAFDPEIQRTGAKLILAENERIAKILGINICARACCVKPAGSTSCILGTASGIHPHHAKRYFRRVQANQNETPLHYFKQFNPTAVEKSLWTDTDEIITFLCEVPDGAKTKNTVNALELLENVRSTQQNWVEYGTRQDKCIRPWIRHNVSNTITVKPDEWDEVEKFIYRNRRWFAGISLLPISGDKDYVQSPFTAVYTPHELVKIYGDASVFASGLITDALRAFDNNLWDACDCILGIGEILDVGILKDKITLECKTNGENWKEIGLSESSPIDLLKAWLVSERSNYYEKRKWVSQAKKFANRYFDGDIRRMTYCMKDVHNWKIWCDLKREYVDVDWSGCFEDEYGSLEFGGAADACSGGVCELGDLGARISEKNNK
jgi:ribonucleoside-diphosphate reductase alpha chain